MLCEKTCPRKGRRRRDCSFLSTELCEFCLHSDKVNKAVRFDIEGLFTFNSFANSSGIFQVVQLDVLDYLFIFYGCSATSSFFRHFGLGKNMLRQHCRHAAICVFHSVIAAHARLRAPPIGQLGQPNFGRGSSTSSQDLFAPVWWIQRHRTGLHIPSGGCVRVDFSFLHSAASAGGASIHTHTPNNNTSQRRRKRRSRHLYCASAKHAQRIRCSEFVGLLQLA